MSSAQIQILKPGSFTTHDGEVVRFSAADMEEIRAGYDPTLSAAPFVIGHPETDSPAYGWAAGLDVVDGVLVAKGRDVDAKFSEAVNAGRFERISVALYPRDHSENPTPGKLALKHVGFFGAHAVAVKGLEPARFSEAQSQGCLTLAEFSPTIFSTEEEPSVADKEKAIELAEREAALKVREDAQDAREKKAVKDAADARHVGHLAFAERVIGEAKVEPHRKDQLVHILDLVAAPGVLSFGEGEKAESAVEIVKGWFEGKKPLLQLAEVAGKDKIADQPDSDIDPVKLAQDAIKLCEQRKGEGSIISVADAVRELSKKDAG